MVGATDDSGRTVTLTACGVDLTTGTVHRDGQAVALTTRETDLLRFLVQNRDRVVSRDQILAQVFGYDDEVVSRACDNTVRRLRSKIEVDPAAPDHLLTVHGTGYRFVLGHEESAPVAPPVVHRPIVALGPTRIDLQRRRVLRPDGDVGLTEPEAALFDLLHRADGRVVDRRTLIRAGWGERVAGGQRFLDNTMSGLRAKIEPNPSEPRYLHTARGTGYRLELPPDRTRDPDLLGRDELVATALGWIASSAWVLLVGPAGVGKSRLARHLAAQVDRAVIWVDCTAARTALEGAAAVAAAVGAEIRGNDAIEVIRQALARRTAALVVLDNLEQAPADFGLLVTTLLRAAPGVKWIGTSRVRLGVADERVVEVDPLDGDAAVALFLRRAVAASPGTPPLDGDLATVRQLVDRLDRIPLAIELAAPRIRILTVAQLLARLGVDLLVSPNAADGRHRSLRATIGASLEALSPETFAALVQISVFVRGLFVDDAEGLFGSDAIDLLQTLRDHSLLQLVPDDTGLRFATWQAVRELLEPYRDPAVVRRHCAWLALRGDWDHLRSMATGEAHARQRALLDEVVAATRLALAAGDGTLAAGCALAAIATFQAQGPHAVGIRLVDEVLAAAIPGALRADLLERRGFLRLNTAQSAEATGDFVAAAALAREHGNLRAECTALHRWANQEQYAGHLSESRAVLVRAIEAARGSEMAAFFEAILARRDGDLQLAEQRFAECAQGTSLGIGVRTYALERLADLAYEDGRLGAALAWMEEAYEIRAGIGQTTEMYNLVPSLLDITHEQGDHEAASQWVAAGLRFGSVLPNRSIEAAVLARSARGALWRGEVDQAAEALDMAERLALDGVHALVRGLIPDIRAQWCTVRGDFEGATEAARRSADLYASVHDAEGVAFCERHHARCRLAAGDRHGARVHAERAPAGSRRALVGALVACTLGQVAVADGDLDEASRCLAWARRRFPEGTEARGTELGWAIAALLAATSTPG